MQYSTASVTARHACLALALAFTIRSAAGTEPAAQPPAQTKSTLHSAADRLFTLKIFPLLKSKCFGCHGDDPDDIRGEFDMRSRAGLLRGGESAEPSIVPGKPLKSPLYQAVRWNGLEMPPKENDRLTETEIGFIRQWIAAGSPWPDASQQKAIRQHERSVAENEDGVLVSTSGGLAGSWTYRRYDRDDVWAFLPVKKWSAAEQRSLLHEVVQGRHGGEPTSSDRRLAMVIDHFIERRLHTAGIERAPQAAPRVLIRRATFDLTGLPPTPEEVAAFLSDWSRNPERAWRDLIDRLLASPQYGEHWGRHWLDVTRYADTGGMSNDYERSNMWRYRDYVIRAFNSDKPYDEFIVEQLAGDELADQSMRARQGERAVHPAQLSGKYTDEEAQWIVATGFLRLGPWDNAMVAADEARQMYLDDLVNITGQTFLAQTLRCCKCHDHKFDPLPTRDYYRIYAAFAGTQMAERPVPLLAVEQQDGFATGKAHVQRMLDFATAEKDKLIARREAAARAWFDDHGLPYKNEQQRKNLPDEQKPPRHVGLNHVEQGRLKVREQDEWIWTRRLERYQPLAQTVFNAESTPLAWNGARKLRINRRGKNRVSLTSHILIGGALTARGVRVQPGVLSALAVAVDTSADDPYLVTSSVDGRRLELARWIARPDNALTTRAIVNRVWQYHFGAGLAANANNFGAKGGKPSHPRLLDYLAADFVENGWTIKRLHRAIMTSETYRRAATPADAKRVARADANNRLLSHFPRRRLGAEEIRDGILSITGELNRAGGGVPVMPEINMEVALQPRMIQFSLAPAYQPSRTPAERNRRTVYAYHVRGQADPFAELFNQPNPNESCERRESAAVAPQACTLLNSDLMTDRSIAFALRLQREAVGAVARIELAFELAFGRPATAEEVERLEAYLTDMVAYHEKTPARPVVYPTGITRSLVEELSGKVFEYREILPVFENYVADRKAADVSAGTRALADVCLLLLNANEFLYVE